MQPYKYRKRHPAITKTHRNPHRHDALDAAIDIMVGSILEQCGESRESAGEITYQMMHSVQRRAVKKSMATLAAAIFTPASTRG
jgi:hypothetical protein